MDEQKNRGVSKEDASKKELVKEAKKLFLGKKKVRVGHDYKRTDRYL